MDTLAVGIFDGINNTNRILEANPYNRWETFCDTTAHVL